MPGEPEHVRPCGLIGEREDIGDLPHDQTDRKTRAGENECPARVEWPRVTAYRVGQPSVLDGDAGSEGQPVTRGDHAAAPASRRRSA